MPNVDQTNAQMAAHQEQQSPPTTKNGDGKLPQMQGAQRIQDHLFQCIVKGGSMENIH